MTDKNKLPVDTNGEGKGTNTRKIFLIVSVSVLVVALAVSAVLLLGDTDVSEHRVERLLEFGTVMEGVSIGGVDISGMTDQEARELTEGQVQKLISDTQLSFDIGGAMTLFESSVLGLSTDYEQILSQAVDFGRTGSFEERFAQTEQARDGIDFTISITAQTADVRAALGALGSELNSDAQDASYVFTPHGHFADGTPYDPDNYDEKTLGAPQLVRLTAEEMPNKLRYQYYNHNKYEKDYIPVDASIARFFYTPEQRGLDTDMDALADLIISAVENNDFSVIAVPTNVTEPTVTLEEIKVQTQLVSSWTSSYREHDGASRVFNVAKLSGIINGVEIKPGELFSVNKTAGPRTTGGGWKEASGIENGAFTPQAGGGVCQISSTLHNAALRANLEITKSKQHSIISDYIPIGLDATISTGGPDLEMKNNYGTPMFVISYMNPKEKNVTVEIYGPPMVHETHGPVILNFTSKKTGTGATPGTDEVVAPQTPDGKPVPVGGRVSYVTPRPSTSAAVYIHYLDLSGTELDSKLYYNTSYRQYRGKVFINPPEVHEPEQPQPGAPPIE